MNNAAIRGGTKEPGSLCILIKPWAQPNSDEVYPNFNCVLVSPAPLVLLLRGKIIRLGWNNGAGWMVDKAPCTLDSCR